MNTLPTLSVANVTVRQHDGLYSLNDLHKASGGAAKHEPNQFTRLDQTQALIAELSKSADLRNYIQTKRGKHNGGTFACRELVIAYAAWISPAFHLQVIRVFLDSVAAQRRIDESRPYAVLPGQTLSAEQADELRRLLTEAAQKLPHAQQGAFLQRGWSKLKAHFGVPYRQIPASQYSEAVSLIARHAADAAPALPVPAMQAPTATLDAHTLYRVWFLCSHFKHLFRIYRDSRLYQHLTGLGSRVGIEMHGHFLDGMSGGADALERTLGHHFTAARRYLRDVHGIQSGEIQ